MSEADEYGPGGDRESGPQSEDAIRDEYNPATDPGGNRPGGERVRFERDASGNEQSIFGGSAADIERSIMEDTTVNLHVLGSVIKGVHTIKDDLGAGPMKEVTLQLQPLGAGQGDYISVRIAWTEQGLVMAMRRT